MFHLCALAEGGLGISVAIHWGSALQKLQNCSSDADTTALTKKAVKLENLSIHVSMKNTY